MLAGLLSLTVGTAAVAQPATDALPSWNEGPVKQSILDFVARVTTEGSPDFVPAPERIATFDNDGTLWTEQPFYFQLAFAIDRVKALAPRHPEWKAKAPFNALLSNDAHKLAQLDKKGLLEIVAAAHTGVSTDEFTRAVVDWTRTARHPRFDRPYTELVFQPMLELLAHLRGSGFKTFVVSGGGIEFMRPWMEKVYGIPPEQIVGSSGAVTFEIGADGKPRLLKQPKIEFIDDGAGKPVGINRFIGRWPVLAVGNSDGDLQMLQYTAGGNGPRLAVYIHPDDAEREFAYDRTDRLAKLDKGLDEANAKGWVLVSMKRDWNAIFPPEK